MSAVIDAAKEKKKTIMPNYSDNTKSPDTSNFKEKPYDDGKPKNQIPTWYLPRKGYYIGWSQAAGLRILSDRYLDNPIPLHFIISEKRVITNSTINLVGAGTMTGSKTTIKYTEHPESLLREIISKQVDYQDLVRVYVQPRNSWDDSNAYQLNTTTPTIIW